MRIRQQLVTHPTRVSPGTNRRVWITIHETANRTKGANAAAHANLQSKGNSRDASWHWQVDDTEAVQSYLHTLRCWHAGDGGGPGLDTIAIEICVNSDGDLMQAYRNAAELVRIIRKDEPTVQGVAQHHDWSGKNCPTILRSGSAGLTWAGFLALTEEDDMSGYMTTVQKGLTNPSSGDQITGEYALQIAQHYAYRGWGLDIEIRNLLVAQQALITNLTGAVAALGAGEKFDPAKLEAGVLASAEEGSRRALEAAIPELLADISDMLDGVENAPIDEIKLADAIAVAFGARLLNGTGEGE